MQQIVLKYTEYIYNAYNIIIIPIPSDWELTFDTRLLHDSGLPAWDDVAHWQIYWNTWQHLTYSVHVNVVLIVHKEVST